MIALLTNINSDTGFKETIQWTFIPEKLDFQAMRQILGTLKTDFLKWVHSTKSSVSDKSKEIPLEVPFLI